MSKFDFICIIFLIVCLESTTAPLTRSRSFTPCYEHENVLAATFPDDSDTIYSITHIRTDGIQDSSTPCSLFYYNAHLCSKVRISAHAVDGSSNSNILQQGSFRWKVTNYYNYPYQASEFTAYTVDLQRYGDEKLIFKLTFGNLTGHDGPITTGSFEMNEAYRKRKDGGIYIAAVYTDENKKNYVFRTCRRDIHSASTSSDAYFTTGGFAIQPFYPHISQQSSQLQANHAYDIFFSTLASADNVIRDWHKIPR